MSETAQSGLSDNTVGAISYITFVPAAVFLMLPPYNANPDVRFHAWQSIFLNAAAFVVSVAVSLAAMAMAVFMPYAWYVTSKLVWLSWMLIWILCVVYAINGKRLKLPLIGAFAEKQAGA
jgi:uncharacterized membrane protein